MLLPRLKHIYMLVVVNIIFLTLPLNLLSQPSDDLTANKIAAKAENYMLLAKYDSAIYYYDNLIKYYESKSNWEEEIKYSLKLVEAYRIMDLFVKADSCLGVIKNNPQYNLEDYPGLKAEFLHQKGTSFGDQGKYQDAIDMLNEVVKIRTELNGAQDTLLAKTFNNIGTYYYYLGDLKKASAFYEKALDLAKQTQAQSQIASVMQNIGIIYARMGDFENALRFFNDNLTINRQVLKEDDPDIAQIYLNRGQLYSLLGRYEEALKDNDLAEQIYVKRFGKEYGSLGTIYLNKSRIYGQLSDPEEAEKYLKNALVIYNLYLKPNHPNIARIYNNLGIFSIAKKNYEGAKEYFQKSLSIQKDPGSQAILLRNLANVYDKLGEFSEAEIYFKISIEKVKSELGKDHYEYGNSLEDYSEFLIKHHKLSDAGALIEQALTNHLLNYNLRNTNLSDVYQLYGRYYLDLGNYKQALAYFQKAMISDDFVFADTSIFQNPDMENIISEPSMLSILLNKADVFSKLYEIGDDAGQANEAYLKAGIKCYQDAMHLYEKLRSKLKYESQLLLMDKTSTHFNSAYLDYFSEYEKNNRDTAYLGPVFEFIEKNKAAVLLSSMKNLDAIKFGGIPESDQTFEKQLKVRISGYENLIYNEKQLKKPDSSRIVLWEKRLFDLSSQYDSLISFFGEHYPAYYNLKYDHNVMNVAEVQKKIDKDQAIVEYTLTDSVLFTFLITKEKSDFYKTVIDSGFFHNLSKLQSIKNIDIATHNLDDYKEYVSASYAIYNTLFSKVGQQIKDKRLIIIPDGRLGYLAFESLVTRLPDMSSINYRSLDYLIKNNPISYSYSSTLLFKNLTSKSRGNEVLAFAPSYNANGNITGNKQSILREKTSQLLPLINAQEEVTNVTKIFPGKVFRDDLATESNFKLNSPNFDVLHLAMHTIIDDENPMYSKMVFTMNNDSVEDGYLNTFEIYNLNLSAQLAVLSACNTGSGKILNGEGIMSLARGFIYAGVPDIIMTLWEVNDKSGADIMTRFYSYLKEGYSKDVALQKAKLDYISNAPQIRANPYFWSAYVNIGDTSPLRKNNMFNYLIWLGLAILLVFVVFVYKRKRLPR